MSGSLHYLEKNTARLITSNQVIQGPYNAVKELVENALDAHATSIEVRLDNFGLDKVEVKDNGSGIGKSDVAFMFLPGHSSKIKDFADLEKLSTYGFRGEALAALCCIAKCAVTTMTSKDSVAFSFKFDSEGNVIEKKPSHASQGTVITVSQLFYHQPARRRMLLSGKGGAGIGSRNSASLSQIRSYLGALGVAWPDIRISLIHNGSLVWRKQPITPNIQNPLIKALGEAIGHTQAANLQNLSSTMETGETINLLVPKIGCKVKEICQSSKAAMIIIINKRVLHHKKIESVLNQHFRSSFSDVGHHKYPVCVAELQLHAGDIDINLEPDKSKIFINAEKETYLLENLQKLLTSYYTESQKTISIKESSQVLDKDLLCESPVIEDINFEPVVKRAKVDIVLDDARTSSCSTDINFTPTLPGYSVEIISEPKEEVSFEKHSEDCKQNNIGSSSSSQVSDANNASDIYLSSTPSTVSNPLESSYEELDDMFNASSTLSDEQFEALAELEKLYQNTSKETPETPTSIQLDSWSRGQLKTSSGTVEGCGILTPEPLLLQPDTVNSETVASPSSQMGCKELAGFSLFCKEERPQILQENPGVVFTMVAQMLARRWKEIPTIEKVRYGELAKELKIIKRTKQMYSPLATKVPAESLKRSSKANPEKVRPVTTISLVTKEVSPNIKAETKTSASSLMPELETKTPQKNTSTIVPKNEIKFVFNIATMEKIASKSPSCTDTVNTACHFEVVGRLKSCVLLKHGLSIDLLRPWAMRETLLLKRLQAEMVLPVTQLEVPFPLTTKDIGCKAWLSLAALETTWDVIRNCTYICSPLITSNGFQITVTKQEDCNELRSAHITHVTTVIDNYGVHNLQELLLVIASTPNCSLQQSRCQAVTDYLKNRAEQGSVSDSDADLQELLEQWNSIGIDDSHCFHGKDISAHLISVDKREVNSKLL